MQEQTDEIIALSEKAMETLVPLSIEYGTLILSAMVIFIVGKIIVNIISGFVSKMLKKAKLDPTIQSFVHNLVYTALMAFLILAVLSKLGIQTASFIAVLGAAGLAVGLALQGSLSNFAAGVLLVLFRPFKEGDYVEAAGTAGSIEKIQIFSTQLITPDNKQIIVPNASIIGGNIINYSAKATRRVDFTVGVAYDSDLKQTREVLRKCIEARTEILKDKDVTIVVGALADSSVNFTVRVWVNSADYWAVFFGLNEAFKEALDAAGISIPFPQMDVHLSKEA